LRTDWALALIQLRFLQYFAARVVGERVIADQRNNNSARTERHQQNEIELV